MRAVGSSLTRPDTLPKVMGAARYPGDIDIPGQAWLYTVFAGIPHGRITAVHTEAALAAPGVLAVLTAADVPVNEYGLIMMDQPVICGTGSTEQAEYVLWEADRIALVIAESAEQAEAAGRLIRLEHEPLPVLTDPFQALQPDAPLLHPREFRYPYGTRDLNSNVLLEYHIVQGDVEQGFAMADVIIEADYQTHWQEHAYLQPEAGVARVLPDGRVEVTCAGQWMHDERHQIAHALNIPEDQVVVRHATVGGAFGGREDISIQIALALATVKVGRPVKMVWTREQSIIGHHKRHPYTIHARWGATRDGKIVAAEMDLTSDCGAYASVSTKVLGNAVLASLGPYTTPNVRVRARTVYTNNTPSGAFRGFGGPQAQFASEMQVNKLAEALHMDPVEMRMRNLWQEDSILATGSPLPPGCSVREVVARAADEGGWFKDEEGVWSGRASTSDEPARPHPLTSLELSSMAGSMPGTMPAAGGSIARGVGFACCYKNVGFSLGAPEHCYAWVELQGNGSIEHAIVGCVGAEVGQGSHAVFRQIAAKSLGIDVERVEVRADNSDITGTSGSASASRMTFMAGNAIVGAAQRALRSWQEEERPARAEYVYWARPTTPYDRTTGAGDPNVTYGYCAQVAEVSVDLETGHVTLERLISVNDVGHAINPLQVEGQIEGAVAQSAGWTLMEEYIVKDGRAQTQRLSTYLIPSVLDVAREIEPLILEVPDPQGPLGARGMGEMPFIPTAAAIGAAIHNATGVWIDTLPYKPERVWRAVNRT